MSFFFFKQKTAYEMRISDWSSDVCSSDLNVLRRSVFTAHINHDRHRECGVEEDDASPAAHPSRRCDPPARASIGQGNSGGVLCPPYTRNASCSQCIRSCSGTGGPASLPGRLGPDERSSCFWRPIIHGVRT